MVVKINYSAAKEIHAFPVVGNDFDISQTPVQVVSGGTPGTTNQVLDRLMTDQTTATVTNNARVNASVIAGYRSTRPTIAVVDASGYVTYLSGVGVQEARIIADGPHLSKSIFCNVSQSGGVSTSTFTGYAAGSLARKLSLDLDTMLAGKTPEANGQCFTSFNPFTRNPNCWAASVDLTPLSIQNSYYFMNSSPTLITPRHFIQCHHYAIPPGNWIQYLSQDNIVCQRNVADAVRITTDGNPAHGLDMWLGRLDADVDLGISHCKFMPSNWQTKLPSIGRSASIPQDTYNIPILMQDKNKGAWVYNWYYEWITTVGVPPYNFTYMQGTQPLTGIRAPFAHYLIGGDSGSSGCVIFNNQLVIVAPIGGGAGSGASCTEHRDRINTQIVEMGSSGGYQCETIDISSYPSFP